MRVIVIEDDPSIAKLLQKAFERDRCDVQIATNGREGVELVEKGKADVVLLDLGLPDIDGREVLREIRSAGAHVIVVTARGDTKNKVVALEEGADDYVTKPFSVSELVARAHAVVRRTKEATSTDHAAMLKALEISVSDDNQSAYLRNRRLDLTRPEYEVIKILVKHVGEIVPQGVIAESVWGDNASDVTKRVETCVNGIKRKIAATKAGDYIEAVGRKGYRLNAAQPRFA